MAITEITSDEYITLTEALGELPLEQTGELRSLLAAKYYAYLDRAIQCKKAVSEYEQIAERVRSRTSAGRAP